MAATGSGLQLPVRGHRRGDKVKATRSGHGHGSGHADPLQPGAKCAQEANGGSDPCAHDRTRADKSAGRPRADPGRRALVTYGFPGGAARTCAMTRRGARSVRHAHHAVAEALRLHLAHMTSPLTFDGLLADHRPAFLFKRLVLVPCMRLLRGLSRSRQRDQRKHQYDRPHLHLSLRAGFAIREINLRASRAFCEFFVTLACWPHVACRRCRACDRRVACSAPGFSAIGAGDAEI